MERRIWSRRAPGVQYGGRSIVTLGDPCPMARSDSPMLEHFRTFARYNAWANDRLAGAIEKLEDADYYRTRSCFFGSIHATLNHLLVGDRAWLDRMVGNGPQTLKLDAILYEDRTSFAVARAKEDARIIALSDQWSEKQLLSTLHYRSSDGTPYAVPMLQVLGHFFNHQTHHRAQIHDMLSQTVIKPPPLDLIYYIVQPA